LVPLIEETDRYAHDFDRIEETITDHTSLLLLCNPHNPVGRVFDRTELERLAETCMRHNMMICTDEIHSDIVFDGRRHVPIASLAPEIAARCATFFAPSKTFNIPGLYCSIGVIQDPETRARFEAAREGLVPSVNSLGLVAALAAYQDGTTWLEELLRYLQANRDYLRTYIATHIPGIKCKPIEGTFLAWLDCRELPFPATDPQAFFLEKARVALNDGVKFGFGGEGFVRLNFGCPRATLVEALERMRLAVENL
jgi:cystathionine beta-lyase